MLEKYKTMLGSMRWDTFSHALSLCERANASVFVETGTMRSAFELTSQSNDGSSTLVLSDYCSQHPPAHLWSVDISGKPKELAANATAALGLFRDLVTQDSVVFLSNFNLGIDFLYLDSYDYGPDPLPCQIHQLAELGAAYGKLTQNAVILLDDVDLPGGGKAGLTIPFLKERGWREVARGYQAVYIRA